MHSPVTTAFRAVVMLSCLIAIPAVAICGKSLPGTLQGLVAWGRQASSTVGTADQTTASAGRRQLDQVSVPASPGDGPGEAVAGMPEELTRAEKRLRRLGATYYRLETWGDRQKLFRFCCRVAVGDSPRYTRYFEATDAEPVVAMNRVLGEVEAWRVGR